MAPTIPTTEPTNLVIGTTWKWNPTPKDYPASDGWSLKYRLVGATTLEIPATNTGSGFTVSVAFGQTDIPPGTYSLVGSVELAGERFECYRATVVVVDAGIGAKKGDDRRAWCEKTLPIVEAALAGQLTGAVAEWSIAGKSIKNIPVEQLWAIRAALRQELYTLRTGRPYQPLRVRFGRG